MVDGRGDILYLHGSAGRYLELTPGEAGVNNILKMAREGLRRELTTTLRKAVVDKETVRRPGLRVKTNGDFLAINLTVTPVAGTDAKTEVPLYLVVLEEAPPDQREPPGNTAALPTAATAGGADTGADVSIAALRQELQAKEEYLQASNEALETSNEELKSFNEEMQSVNEEMQSTNEELETSKEELQSVNEELATVNAELQTKVVDLSRANNDMNNLLAGTGIGTVFVDTKLRILRFTPTATRIINLILSDIGRPVGHLVPNLVGYNSLPEDVTAVLDSLIPKEMEVQTTAGAWYTMRIQPYRTLDNVIEGAVITFVDVSERRRAEAALRESDSYFRQLMESVPQLVWACLPDGLFDYLSPRWVEITGVPEAQQLGRGWSDLAHPKDRKALAAAWDGAMATGEPFDIEFRLRHHDGDYRPFAIRVAALRNIDGRVVKWFGLNTEIGGRRLEGAQGQGADERPAGGGGAR